jgi:hypothetical protein
MVRIYWEPMRLLKGTIYKRERADGGAIPKRSSSLASMILHIIPVLIIIKKHVDCISTNIQKRLCWLVLLNFVTDERNNECISPERLCFLFP